MGDYIYNVGYFDLAAGYEFLQEMKTTFGTNFISSNIVKAGTEELAFISHEIIEKNGLKIGVFGITTTLPATEKAIEVKDYVESAKIKIAELRPQVDLLVMLFNSTRVQALNAMDDLSKVDYIYLSRETTRTRPEKSQDPKLPLTYSFGIQGKYVGRFDVDIADKTQPIKDVTSAMMTVSIFEQRLNNLQKRDLNQPLEEIYKNNPNVLNMVSQYKDGLAKSKSVLTDKLNTSFYSLIPLGSSVPSEKTLLAVVDETLKTCNTLDKKGLQSLN